MGGSGNPAWNPLLNIQDGHKSQISFNLNTIQSDGQRRIIMRIFIYKNSDLQRARKENLLLKSKQKLFSVRFLILCRCPRTNLKHIRSWFDPVIWIAFFILSENNLYCYKNWLAYRSVKNHPLNRTLFSIIIIENVSEMIKNDMHLPVYPQVDISVKSALQHHFH